jgi:hypothetical protein
MTCDDIIRMARVAGIPGAWDLNWFDPYLERFAALVAAAEREACAKVCDEFAARDKLSNYYAVAANAIRARGQA